MTSPLSTVPIGVRRRAAALLALMAALLLVIGILPWTSPAPAAVRVLAVVAVLVAVLAALIAWGLSRSTTIDRRRAAHAELDAVLVEAAGACDCGHDHVVGGQHIPASPPTTVESAACAVGAADCTHSCDTCVLTSLRE